MIKLSTLTHDQLITLKANIDNQLNAGVGTDLGLEIKLEPSTLKDLIHAIEQVQTDSRRMAESLIKTAFLEFFNQCPRVKSVVWTQYAPYFNDGDPCIFRVHDPEVHAFNEGEDEDDYGYGESGILGNEDFERETEIFENLLFPLFKRKDIMEHVFGSDSIITASREGFDIREYDHD